MLGAEPNDNYLASLHLPAGEPSPSWSIDDLGAAAAAEWAALVAEEQTATARYWRLGRLLSLARKPLTHGQWGMFLKQWEIDKSRASKALRIFQAFATAEETVGLTVAEACQRKTKPRRRRNSRREPQPLSAVQGCSVPPLIQSWSQFADLMTGVVERQLEEPEFLTPDEAATALTSLGRLLAALRNCEERLRHRTLSATPT